MRDPDINYTKEAFLNTWNLAFLAVAAGLAVGIGLVGGFPGWALETVLLLAGGAEVFYLGMMSRNERFRRHIRSQKAAEKRKPPTQREIFSQLRNRSQRRYAKLRKLRDQIQANYQKLSYASQGLLDSHVKKIDGLLESYLELLHQRERYRDFMDSATEDQIVASIEALKEDMSDDSERVRTVKQRRLNVLEQRLARLHKARENLEIIGAQLGTIEDVVKYIHEQSWTLQNPQEVAFQLDALLEEVEETQSSIREIEDVFTTPSDYIDDELDALEDAGDVSASAGPSEAAAREMPPAPEEEPVPADDLPGGEPPIDIPDEVPGEGAADADDERQGSTRERSAQSG
jgi:hypothetical protein